MNLMDLFIRIGVDDQATSGVKSISQSLGNGLKTAAKVGIAAVSAASAAVVALAKESVESFAEYEQLAGGAQKIFDEMDSSRIMNDAAEAYKTLGLSANQYLKVINDVGATFSATMGDEAGYESAKKGLQAISDYASGTGKNVDELSQKFMMITRSTSSYQSIADQFSGILPATSADFLEQAKSVGALSETYTKLTEVPVAEYQSAVVAMLEKGVDALGLTGNTAAESATTLSGSIGAMGAAWNNLLTGLADDSQEADVLFDNFMESVQTFGDNLIPRVQVVFNSMVGVITEKLPSFLSAGASLLSSVISGFLQQLPALSSAVPQVVTTVVSTISGLLPQVTDIGVRLLDRVSSGIETGLPDMVSRLPKVIDGFLDFITDNLPKIMEQGVSVLNSLVNGIIDSIPAFASELPKIITSFADFITDNLPTFVKSGIRIMKNLIGGIIGNIPELVKAIPQIIGAIAGGFYDYMGTVISIGTDLIKGIWNGIEDAGAWLAEKISGFFGGVVDDIKDFFGIASPSKLFRDEIGKMMAQGIGVGFEIETPNIAKSIGEDLDRLTKSLDTDIYSTVTVSGDPLSIADQGKRITVNEMKVYFNVGDAASSAEDIVREIDEKLSELFERRIAAT